MADPAVSAPVEETPAAPPKRGGKLRSAEEGGPASIVAPAGHLQRLEQLRLRTTQCRTVWQTRGSLEALRAVASVAPDTTAQDSGSA